MGEHNPSNTGRAARRQGAVPRQRGSAPQKRRTSPLLIAGRTIAVGVSLAVIGTSGVTWYTYKSLTTGLTTSNALAQVQKGAPPHLDNSVNLLLIGLDSRKDMNGNDLPPQFVQDDLQAGGSSDIGGYNTNTLIVLHIPANGGKVTALSIPRDDYVQTAGADGKMHKIKEAYGIAKSAAESKLAGKGLSKAQLEQQSRDVGRAATLATVQNFLGIPIDHFAEVNLLGFYDIAQAVGPVQVCLNHATSDPNETGQGSGFKGTAGINTLNATQSLAFVRQRHNLPNGDLDRTHRQQAFISSVEYKLKNEGIFNDLGKMQDLFNVVKKDVVIDDQLNILDFAQQATNLTGGNVEFNTLPISGFKTIGGEDVNTVDPALIKREVQQLFGHDPAPAPASAAPASSAPAPSAPAPAAPAPAAPAPAAPAAKTGSGTVDVYNASTVSHAAANESQALVDMGYKAGRTGPASTHPTSTTVTYGVGAKDGAQGVAARYGVTAEASSRVPAGHIEVTLGTGYTAPGAAAPAPAAAGSSSTADPAAALPMQGPPVKMGGIPCVN
ncbi:LCP family protein required for cell wall assembly [Kitasatospora sp. MAP12-15]|uniref:LCP family protein n=1 Tax=unclassified Kitasatospora TaxID=2633591 RepID=UPI002474F498|nr:LCP family protein [Kitasatospora sp. MAP12-44]MDH6113256.1 LCP family protein required for cell wall assembly [Kitasatospora sp. MAP12-44]